MTKQTPIDAINHVMNALRYSLASYLRFARPWIDASAQSIADTISNVAESHRQHVTRIGELLVERHGHVESRIFPSAFTGLNDLSIGYLIPLVIEDEKQIVRLVEASAPALEYDAEASELVAHIVVSAKLHLQILERGVGHRRTTWRGRSIQARHQSSQWPAEATDRAAIDNKPGTFPACHRPLTVFTYVDKAASPASCIRRTGEQVSGPLTQKPSMARDLQYEPSLPRNGGLRPHMSTST